MLGPFNFQSPFLSSGFSRVQLVPTGFVPCILFFSFASTFLHDAFSILFGCFPLPEPFCALPVRKLKFFFLSALSQRNNFSFANTFYCPPLLNVGVGRGRFFPLFHLPLHPTWKSVCFFVFLFFLSASSFSDSF